MMNYIKNIKNEIGIKIYLKINIYKKIRKQKQYH